MRQSRVSGSHNNGFTLVELLVAMVLTTGIFFIGSYAYSLFADKWDGELGKFEQQITHGQNMILVHRVLQSIAGYIAADKAGQAQLVFDGTNQRIRAVTQSPVAVSDIALFELEWQQNEKSATLYYRERTISPMSDKETLLVKTGWDFEVNVLTAEGKGEFRYFGWPDIEQKALYRNGLSVSQATPDWFRDYATAKTGLLPIYIEVIFADERIAGSLIARLIDKAEMQVFRYADQT